MESTTLKDGPLVVGIWRFGLVVAMLSSIVLVMVQTGWGVHALSVFTAAHLRGSKAPLLPRPFFDPALIVATNAVIAQLQRPEFQSAPIVLQWFIARDNAVANPVDGLLHYQLYPRGVAEQFLVGRTPRPREREVLGQGDGQVSPAGACTIEWRSESDITVRCPGSTWRYQPPAKALP